MLILGNFKEQELSEWHLEVKYRNTAGCRIKGFSKQKYSVVQSLNITCKSVNKSSFFHVSSLCITQNRTDKSVTLLVGNGRDPKV
jgi:hypothetical protein